MFLFVSDQHLTVDETTDFEQLTRTLGDILLAATICKVDLVPWLLNGLIRRLKSLAAKFSVFVPDGLYLPAPPVHCPQPPLTQQVKVPTTRTPSTTTTNTTCKGLYLPAPPVHCPQPPLTQQVKVPTTRTPSTTTTNTTCKGLYLPAPPVHRRQPPLTQQAKVSTYQHHLYTVHNRH